MANRAYRIRGHRKPGPNGLWSVQYRALEDGRLVVSVARGETHEEAMANLVLRTQQQGLPYLHLDRAVVMAAEAAAAAEAEGP